jgi:hypothetical protein
VPAETPAALHPHIASLDNPQAMVASQSAMAAFDPVAADLGEKIERIDVAGNLKKTLSCSSKGGLVRVGL